MDIKEKTLDGHFIHQWASMYKEVQDNDLAIMNQLPPITPQPDLLSHIYFLKREWEHAMQVSTIKGRDIENIQQLMHAQFQFLEHVVLDMSKQLRHFQDQLLSQQKANMQLQDTVSHLEQRVIETEKKTVEKETKEEYNKKMLDINVKDFEAKVNSLTSKVDQQEQQTLALVLKSNNQDVQFQNLYEKQSVLQEQAKELTSFCNQTNKEIEAVKSLFSTEQQAIVKEKLSFQETISNTYQETLARLQVMETQLNSRLDGFQTTIQKFQHTFDASKLERSKEQESIIQVLNVLKSTISSIRAEQRQFESKTISNINSTFALLKDQFSRDLRFASKPIVVH